MPKYTLPAKTYNQLASEFATAFKTVMPPAKPKPVSQAEWLEFYRPHIMKQRARGLTWKQISEVMAVPPISVRIPIRVLRQAFGGDSVAGAGVPPAKAVSGGATASATPTATPPAPKSNSAPTPSAPPKPASRRYILDPFTNQPITPPPA